MSIRKLLEDAVASNTDPKVAEKLQACIAKNDSLNRYLENTCSEPSALQKIILDDTMAESWKELYNKGITSCILGPMGMSGHYEGIFLKLIAELTKAERILEIGMYTGCSAVSFCESTFSKEVVSLEYEPYLEEFVTKRTKNTIAEKKHRILIGKALDSLEKLKLEGKTFDLVFIDADKNNYLNYYNVNNFNSNTISFIVLLIIVSTFSSLLWTTVY